MKNMMILVALMFAFTAASAQSDYQLKPGVKVVQGIVCLCPEVCPDGIPMTPNPWQAVLTVDPLPEDRIPDPYFMVYTQRRLPEDQVLKIPNHNISVKSTRPVPINKYQRKKAMSKVFNYKPN